jgi:5-methylthioribose kinase
LTQDIEEERRILALAARAGLSSIYDASSSSYAQWRSKVLTFAQLLQEKENNERTIQDHRQH